MKTYTTPTYGLDLTDEYNAGWLDSNDFIVTLKSHGVRLEKSTSAGTATLDVAKKILYFSLSQMETARLGKGYVKVELTCKKSGQVGKSNTDEFYLDDAIRKELETTTTSSEQSVRDLKHRTVKTSSGEVRIIEPKMPKVKIEPYTPESSGTKDHNQLDNKDMPNQHPISAISGLEDALNAKYTKPASGVPKTDLASDVQGSLTKADEAYVKPTGGVAKTDLASDVQTSLGKADSALQDAALTPYRTSADQDVIDNGKQDVISDLSTIRSGAQSGSTAAQPADVTSAISTHNSATDAHSTLFDAKQDKCVKKTATINVADWGSDRKANVTIDGLKVDSDLTQMVHVNFSDSAQMRKAKPFFTCSTAGTLTAEWNGSKPTTAVTVVVVMEEI